MNPKFIAKMEKRSWISESSRAITAENGTILYYEGSGIDITERKKAQETLQKSAEEYRYLTNASLDGFWQIDSDGKLLDVNKSCCQMSGYNREELLDLQLKDLQAAESEEQMIQHFALIKKKGHERFEPAPP